MDPKQAMKQMKHLYNELSKSQVEAYGFKEAKQKQENDLAKKDEEIEMLKNTILLERQERTNSVDQLDMYKTLLLAQKEKVDRMTSEQLSLKV